MKQIYHILCLLALATLGACQTGDDTNGQEENGQITIKFTAEPLTRTTLASSDNVQHVKYVQVYVFEGTDASAVCVASENVGWKQLQPGGTVTQYYTLKQKLDDGKTYTILAVGLDNDNDNSEHEGSGYAYGLPDAIKVKSETEEGTTLGNAKATLAEGRTAAAMNKAELFAGSNTVTVQPGANRITEITLMRRVAGVMAYFTNIPSDVEEIQLILYDNQYKDVPLIAQTSNDYGTEQLEEEEGSTVLLDIEVRQDILEQEVVYASDGKTVVGTKLPGTVLQGAYMLPMPAPESGYTLTLVQINNRGETKQKNNLVLSNPVSGSTGIKNFPIEANVFYTIGRKDADHDEPYSLGDLSDGDYIYVDGNWQADVDIPM